MSDVKKLRISISDIDASLKEFKDRAVPKKPTALYKMAALLVYFTQDSMAHNCIRVFERPMEDNEWNLLVKNSIELRRDPTSDNSSPSINTNATKWIMEDSERNAALASFSDSTEMRNMLGKLEIRFNNYFQKVYSTYINGSPLPLDKLSLDELVAVYSICNWARNTIITTPNGEELINLIRQKEFIQPFERLTRNFKGRTKELAALDAYFKEYNNTLFAVKLRNIVRKSISSSESKPLLITGIGGVGKSTLAAKFILNNLFTTDGRRVPIIYLDFDRPGLSVTEPMLLVKYALTQLRFQFPSQKPVFDVVSNEIDEKFKDQNHNSRSTDQMLVLDKYIQEFQKSEASNLPVLLIMDSFEEIQYRANRSQLNNFLNFIRSISGAIQGLLPLFVGRSELTNLNIDFEIMDLPDFDADSAIAYLESLGVENHDLGALIYKDFKGNPLKLQLVAGLMLKDKVKTVDDFNNKYGNDKKAIDELFKLQYLIQRNLDHIHDERVSAIAIPGLLIRTINPDIVQNVLAEPCGLGKISLKQATEIYDALASESFLITPTNNGISFRMDLRLDLYNDIMTSYGEKARNLRQRAIDYYKEKKSPEEQAEYLYHCLKKDEDPSIILSIYEDSMRPYLENSLKEFSLDVYVVLASKLNIPVNTDLLEKTTLSTWQHYYSTLIEESLETGDEAALLDINKGLKLRKERDVTKSTLDYYEAKLCERLGNRKELLDAINKALNTHSMNPIRLFPFHVLLSKYHEQEGAYEEAFNVLVLIREQILNKYKEFDFISTLVFQFYIDANFSMIRLIGRLGKNEDVEIYRQTLKDIFAIFKSYNHKNEMKDIRELLPFPYKAFYNRHYPLNEFIDSVTKRYYNYQVYQSLLEGFRVTLHDKSDLEQMVNKRYSLRLKDVCEPGSFDVNKMDVLNFMEIDKDRQMFHNDEKKRIIICCDGIWEQESVFENGKAIQTNVEKLFRLLSDRDNDNLVQLKTYDRGRGKKYSWFNRIIGIFDGKEIDSIIKDMYSFIALNYSKGDDIYLFGFSKGAYITRCLAGFINHSGLLKYDCIDRVDEAYEMYRSRSTHLPAYSETLTEFKDKFCYEQVTTIKFVGVWETVGKLGIPRSMALFNTGRYEFWDTHLPANIENAFQALALDEQRTAYSPCLWTQTETNGKTTIKQRIEQVWFPGVHRNVGGGYDDSGLSDMALEWMIEKAKILGLSFDEMIIETELNPNIMGAMRKAISSFLSISRQSRKLDMEKETNQYIHESVIERMKMDELYKPKNLPDKYPVSKIQKTEPHAHLKPTKN